MSSHRHEGCGPVPIYGDDGGPQSPDSGSGVPGSNDRPTRRRIAFPQVVLLSKGLIALMLMFILRNRAPARPTQFIVHSEIRGLAGDEAGTRVLQLGHFATP